MGSALPTTDEENRLMGAKRNELLEKAREESTGAATKSSKCRTKSGRSGASRSGAPKHGVTGQGDSTLTLISFAKLSRDKRLTYCLF